MLGQFLFDFSSSLFVEGESSKNKMWNIRRILTEFKGTLQYFFSNMLMHGKYKNLLEMNSQEANVFFSSFEHVICDCDGVLWSNSAIYPGVDKALQLLKSKGKKIHFLTNNSVKSQEEYSRLFQRINIDFKNEDLLTPCKAAIHYLKSVNFDKKLYVIASSNLLAELKDAGIQYVTSENESPEELKWFLENSDNDPNIAAVFIDFDINFNYLKLNKVISLLKRSDVMFLVGTTDNDIIATSSRRLIGAGAFSKIIMEYTNREPIFMGKPGIQIQEQIMERFNIKNPERTLFIGDSLDTDMAFADKCKFQKLLVLSGVTSHEDLNHIKSTALKPHYTLPSLADMVQVGRNQAHIF